MDKFVEQVIFSLKISLRYILYSSLHIVTILKPRCYDK